MGTTETDAAPHEFHDLIDELREPTREFRRAAPDVWKGFGNLHKAAVDDGVVPGSMKELVALAIAVADHCDGCVALLMAGGPASVWAPRALAAFDEFSED